MTKQSKIGNDSVGITARKVQRSRAKNRTRADMMPTIFERDGKPRRKCNGSNMISHTHSADRSSSAKQVDFSSLPGMPDSTIHSNPCPTNEHAIHGIFTSPGGDRERGTSRPLIRFYPSRGGKVALNRRRHTVRPRIFGVSKATRPQARTVLLDTGIRPPSFNAMCGSICWGVEQRLRTVYQKVSERK